MVYYEVKYFQRFYPFNIFNFYNLDTKKFQSFIEEFSKNLQENFNLKKLTWNSLSSIHNSTINSSLNASSNPFISLQFSFDDIDNDKNSFLSLAFQQMQLPKPTLLELNR